MNKNGEPTRPTRPTFPDSPFTTNAVSGTLPAKSTVVSESPSDGTLPPTDVGVSKIAMAQADEFQRLREERLAALRSAPVTSEPTGVAAIIKKLDKKIRGY